MCDAGLSTPVPLGSADLKNPFVYDRQYGIFYCQPGYHQSAMSLLLAFHHGFDNGIDVAEFLKLGYSSETADHWLSHTTGSAFKSSVNSKVYAGRPGNLTVIESRIFGGVQYLFD